MSKSKIFTISSLAHALDHICPATMVFADIDETLVTLAQSFGRSSWFDPKLKSLEEMHGRHTALEHLVKINLPLQEKSKVLSVEHNTAHILQQIYDRSKDLVGLTARHPDLATATERQLKSINMDLLDKIIFTRGENKGLAAAQHLSTLAEIPSKVVAIDDINSNLVDIKNVLSEMGIQFIGLHYQPEKSAAHDFCSRKAELQETIFVKSDFEHLISDAEAAELLKQLSLKNNI